MHEYSIAGRQMTTATLSSVITLHEREATLLDLAKRTIYAVSHTDRELNDRTIVLTAG